MTLKLTCLIVFSSFDIVNAWPITRLWCCWGDLLLLRCCWWVNRVSLILLVCFVGISWCCCVLSFACSSFLLLIVSIVIFNVDCVCLLHVFDLWRCVWSFMTLMYDHLHVFWCCWFVFVHYPGVVDVTTRVFFDFVDAIVCAFDVPDMFDRFRVLTLIMFFKLRLCSSSLWYFIKPGPAKTRLWAIFGRFLAGFKRDRPGFSLILNLWPDFRNTFVWTNVVNRFVKT